MSENSYKKPRLNQAINHLLVEVLCSRVRNKYIIYQIYQKLTAQEQKRYGF